MVQTFNFADFSRQCSRSYTGFARQPEGNLASLHRNCETLLERHQPERFCFIACKAGCGSCCIVNVSVLLPEALAIVDYLEAQPMPDRTGFEENLGQVWIRICGVDDEERVGMRQPCAFLNKKGSCTIYPVRPLLCRGVTSTDAERCRQALSPTLCNEDRSVQMNLFQQDLFAAAYLGLSAGLENEGLDERGFELTGIVRYLLRNPERRSELQSGLRLKWSELV